MIKSLCIPTVDIELPLLENLKDCNIQMQRFNTINLTIHEDILSKTIVPFYPIVKEMLTGIDLLGNTAYLTIHGKNLKKGEMLRRGGKHIDGNFDPDIFNWTCHGVDFEEWLKKEAPSVNSKYHDILYNSDRGGILLLSNYSSCLGWVGEFEGIAGLGGDCSHIETNEPFMLERNKVYYGNSTFIHESIPVEEDVYRIMFRITLPRNHIYDTSKINKEKI